MGTPLESVAATLLAAALAVGCATSGADPGPVAPAVPAAADRGEAVPAPLTGLDAAGLEGPALAFVRHCERSLLVRAGAAADAPGGDLRRAWFGGLVAAAPGPAGDCVLALGDVLVETFRAEDPAAGAALAASLPGPTVRRHDWAVPRLMALRSAMGELPFREGMRLLVDRHRDGRPASYVDLAAAMAEAGGPEHGAFAAAWLAGPERPTLRASWRHDGARGRLLVRVDQVHTVADGRPAAYPLTLPLRMHMADGSLGDAAVRVTDRRAVLEVPCAAEPLSVTFDPDGALDGLATVEEDG